MNQVLATLLADPEITAAIGLSLSVSLASTVLVALLGIPTAYALAALPGSRRFARVAWLRGVADFLLLLPLTLPPTVVGYVLLVVFGKQGLLGRALAAAFDVSIVFSPAGAVVASAFVAFPLLVRVATAAFESIEPGHREIARTLGYGGMEILARVVVPLAARGVLAGLALAFCRALGEFGATLMLAGNIPGRTSTMPLALYSFVSSGEWDKANALVVLLVGLSAAFLLAARAVEAKLGAARA